MHKNLIIPLIVLFLFSCKNEIKEEEEESISKGSKPNIILFYVDDLGYGDLSCYGAKNINTPSIDKIANNGIRFTDGHSSAATCTPSRYSLLTGNYAFRKKAAVLKGDAPLLIDTSQTTLPKVLANAGYTTGIVGKWHLGLGNGNIDWNTTIKPGPNEVGFDYSFLLPATGDRVPTVYMENGNVLNLTTDDPLAVSYTNKIGNKPTGEENPELLRQIADDQHNKTVINGVSRIGYMAGGTSAEWIDEKMPYVFNKKANEFISSNKDNPFFLFYSFHDIHVPRIPDEKFLGKSTMGHRGDAILQVDFVVGEIVKKVEELGIANNTIIIFTSDNGPVLDDGYQDKAIELLGTHKPSGVFRGGKYSIYEAGTRVPTIVYWPNTVKPATSNALVNQIDLLASIAKMTSQEINADVIDSENYWNAWIGNDKIGRETMLEEGYTLALRKSNMKYIAPKNDLANFNWIKNVKNIESGISTQPQLFDLNNDISEQKNIANDYPEKIVSYQKEIDSIINLKSRIKK